MQSIPPDKFYQAFLQNFGLHPTEQQVELMQQLVRFVYNPEPQALFVLKGYAGTGKTSVLGAFVKTLKQSKQPYRLLAPTGRAAKVLSQKAWSFAFTIHKQIYRRVKAANGQVTMALAPNTMKNTFFVVDEASMIGDYVLQSGGEVSSSNLLEDLINYVYQGEGCKMVFLGDEGQLPPVGAEESPALQVDYLRNHFPMLDLATFSLTEVVRQTQDSDILINATNLRTVQDRLYPRLHLSRKGDVIKVPGEEVQEYLENSIQQCGQDETIIITRSNKRANQYNNHIRNRLFWFEEELNGGDMLMAVKNNYYWMADSSTMGFVANGEMLRVNRITKTEQLYGFNFAHALVEFVDYPQEGEQDIILLVDTLQVEGPNLPREELKRLFYEIEKDYLDEANKKKRYEKITKNPYFNALQVKYAYAVTCHKSQGGQWEHVYIDQGYLVDDMMDASYYRWLYTAFTRATSKVFLMNFKDEFFED